MFSDLYCRPSGVMTLGKELISLVRLFTLKLLLIQGISGHVFWYSISDGKYCVHSF
jgi:hypothetical protein